MRSAAPCRRRCSAACAHAASGLRQVSPENRAKSPSVEHSVSPVLNRERDARPARDCHARRAGRGVCPALRRIARSARESTARSHYRRAVHRCPAVSEEAAGTGKMRDQGRRGLVQPKREKIGAACKNNRIYNGFTASGLSRCFGTVGARGPLRFPCKSL